ncbi:MAG: glutamate-5-semialdehyde dehydrogenase [Marinicaulis sp.]|nr:glutamate-5-semialdehyde dehydrogenase [Marinicaulis sp.]NNL89924.1 glutamate-5-semialdehyde dehydrogenase [Marinicaulis sp.]
MNGMGRRARAAAHIMAAAETDKKIAALKIAAENIDAQRAEILAINRQEVDIAKAGSQKESYIDRMTLNDERIDGIRTALNDIAAIQDPVGEVIRAWERPNGLKIERVRVPIGVIAVIYESRPNVTVDAAAIALMAGNAVVLRGGSECIKSSGALFKCFTDAVKTAGLPEGAAQFVETSDRAAVGAILGGLDEMIDLVIPRGGKSLVARVQSDARVPVLSHLDGLCHVYIDRDADKEKAIAIAVNSKMRRTGVCGAAETLLIDRAILNEIWGLLADRLREAGCEIRGDDVICALDRDVAPTTEEDWRTEYLAPIISVAAVDGVEGALAHLTEYSSNHTDTIVTENHQIAEQFLRRADSAIVLHNASTQFADGGEFGLGAEIGIATGRLHARGPVGVEELTTYKNVVRGDGQTRS